MDKLVNMQKMRGTESKEDLLKSTEEQAGVGYGAPLTGGSNNLLPPSDVPLGQIEKKFLLHAERGDCATVRRLLLEYKDQPNLLNINCVDPLDRSALISAIENENIELITLLLQEGIQVKDALLHTIKEEYVEAVEILLQWEEEHHIAGQPYSWEAVDRSSSTFTPDITPLILAAHRNNYEILKILLDRGASLPMPHDVRCGCDECVVSSDQDSLRHSQSRINAYRALSASSLIALSSRDPLLTAFELSWELRRLSRMETEFRADYNEMRMQCQEFATSLLDHARTSFELEVMLNYNPYGENWEPGERQTLDRLKLAIKYKQKMFVAHPNVQQLLAAIWYEGLPGFRRKGMLGQIVQVAKLGTMFPIYSAIYMIAPKSKMGLFMKKPFVKFICHSSSYAFFLMLLGLASQRAEYLVLEWIGTPWMRSILADWKRRERGALPGFIEFSVIIYVISLIWNEMRALWNRGLMEYVADLWNIVDFITNVFYMMWISLRFASWFVVQRDSWSGLDPWYPREEWDTYDPMLLSEGAFAAGMIFSFLKLVHIFSINPHLGPLQVSLGRMIIDIIKFFFIYTLVLFAFGCGMNQLMWYYADLEKNKCYHLPNGLPDFDNNEKSCAIWRRYANLFETSQSLFWASFGMVDLLTFELQGIKSFTRFWALLMFGSYSVINVIVLLNMLIAMMSNSYQIISERSDTEWKFARSHLWMSYFDEGDTVPPPFNLIPTTKTFTKTMGCGKSSRSSTSIKKKSKEKAQKRHDTVMRLLVRRFVTAEQRKRDDFGITEDDVLEIRQDISTLRYELIDILKTNGMKTPNIDRTDPLGGKKGRVMERRLLKDFQIGIVEGIVNEVITNEKQPKDVFSQIAKAIGKRTSSSSKNKDWNALVRQNTGARDPIGSTTEALMRQSRQSLRRHIVDNANAGISLDTNKLIEYNPLLSEMPPTARVAYAKFMKTKIKQEMDTRDADDVTQSEAEKASALDQIVVKEGTEDEKPTSSKQGEITLSIAQLSIIRERPRSKIPSGDGTSSVKFKEISDSRDTDASEIEMDSGKLTVEKTHFRSRTPILEDPEEDQEITSDIPEIVTSADIEVEPKSADTQKKEEKASSGVEGLKPKTQLSLPSTSEPPTSTPPRQPTTGVTKEKGRSKVSGKEVTGWI